MINPNFTTKTVKETDDYGHFSIEPLPFSFGHSLGNALRRTLLSSLKGAAITSVRIDGVVHLFSTIDGVKESVLEIVLNLKQLRFKTKGKGPFKMSLRVKGEKKVLGGDFKGGELEVVNKDMYIAQLTDKKARLNIEATVELGYGHSFVEERREKAYGSIPVDAFFSPVRKVNFKVEETRVGRETNFDRLVIEIWTDGSIKPSQALRKSSLLLSEYFSYLLSGKDKPRVKVGKTEAELKQEIESKKLYQTIIDELDLPSRVVNTLLREKIETVDDLLKVGRDKLSKLKGVGKKSIDLIDRELERLGVQLE